MSTNGIGTAPAVPGEGRGPQDRRERPDHQHLAELGHVFVELEKRLAIGVRQELEERIAEMLPAVGRVLEALLRPREIDRHDRVDQARESLPLLVEESADVGVEALRFERLGERIRRMLLLRIREVERRHGEEDGAIRSGGPNPPQRLEDRLEGHVGEAHRGDDELRLVVEAGEVLGRIVLHLAESRGAGVDEAEQRSVAGRKVVDGRLPGSWGGSRGRSRCR